MTPAAAEVLALIRGAACQKPCLLVAVDGRCGAGKTTLAEELRRELSCPVVHADHFFLRPEQRTPARLSEAGGNLDRERLLSEVLIPLSEGRDTAFRPYRCATADMGDPIPVPAAPVVLVEGSYSCHPELSGYYDLRVFLTVSPGEQLRRIADREGAAAAELFKSRWIPLEEAYFSACRVPENADLVLKSMENHG